MRGLVMLALVFALTGCGWNSCGSRGEPTSTAETDKKTCDPTSESCPSCCEIKARADLFKDGKKTPSPALQDADKLEQAIQSHSGKVIGVYVWGSIHPASIKQIPEAVKLQAKYEKDGLVCLTACHALPETGTLAGNLLTGAKCDMASFTVDVSQTIAGEKIFEGLALPAFVVFSREGKKIASFDSKQGSQTFDWAVIDQAVVSAVR